MEAKAAFERVFGGARGMEARMAAAGAPGLSLAVIGGGELRVAATYGAVADADTSLQAASISKPVAAAVALRLVDQGLLDLDAPLAEWLSGWGGLADRRAEGVTLRRLLSHSAGLTVHGFAGYAAAPPLPTTLQTLAGAAPANNAPAVIDLEPGTRWRYSGGGYVLLQLLIERVTGRSFAAVASDLLLGPAGMARSRFDAERPDGDWAVGHDGEGRPLAGGCRHYPELAAAGLWSTPSDLARFALTVQAAAAGQDGAVSPASAALMLRPQIADFSLAFHLEGAPERPVFSHSGANAGYRTLLWVRAGGEGEGAVVMVNGEPEPGFLTSVFDALAEALAWPAP